MSDSRQPYRIEIPPAEAGQLTADLQAFSGPLQ
jgi:hypothetical protein